MKKALIDPRFNRVCQVEDTEFEVGETLFWMDCAEDVVADQFTYDPDTRTLVPIPVVEVAGAVGTNQPLSTGSQTL